MLGGMRHVTWFWVGDSSAVDAASDVVGSGVVAASDAGNDLVVDAVAECFDSDSTLRTLAEWLMDARTKAGASFPYFPAPSFVKGKKSTVKDAAQDGSLSDSAFITQYFTTAISVKSRELVPAFRSLCEAGELRGACHLQWHLCL